MVDVHGHGPLHEHNVALKLLLVALVLMDCDEVDMPLHVHLAVCLWSKDQNPMMPTKAPSWMT